ncbi:hypothetical protein [Streptomyces silvensis]|uniref:Uncharacterized protein n=1 Tax=Streptomyces silvensis TaxID=1765722 RepID=A0A0W7X1V1_9ACTN|nr:hypothetical protein [Streptomyces silvensis]KUF16845.1 hypothetical protein AT728_23340 [Streptomyces silvensis]
MSGVGCALGALRLRALALAERFGMNLLAGLIPAALSPGSLLGGHCYERRSWPGTLTQQLVAVSAPFALSWLPLTAVTSPRSPTDCDRA